MEGLIQLWVLKNSSHLSSAVRGSRGWCSPFDGPGGSQKSCAVVPRLSVPNHSSAVSAQDFCLCPVRCPGPLVPGWDTTAVSSPEHPTRLRGFAAARHWRLETRALRDRVPCHVLYRKGLSLQSRCVPVGCPRVARFERGQVCSELVEFLKTWSLV